MKERKLTLREDHSPQLIYCSNNPFNEQFDDYFFFEITEEIKKYRKKGKKSFLNYLVQNYDIIINGYSIKYLGENDLEVYQEQIFEFF